MADKSDVTVVANGKQPNKRVLIGLIVVGFVLIIGVVWWLSQRETPKPTPTVPQYSGQALLDEVNKHVGKRQYDQAIKLIQGQESMKETDKQLLLASTYANASKYKDALAIYEQLDADDKLNETYSATAADVAERAKEYQQAINWYKQAKQLAPKDATDQIAVYDYKIAELEKQL